MYEVFEHTADFGLRIRAASLEALFAEAGCALFAAIVSNFDAVAPRDEFRFALPPGPHDEMLHDWLDELLFAFHAQRIVCARFAVELDAAGLRAVAWGEPIDTARHQLDCEIKAITYHGLQVVRQGDDWLAEVIVDI
jgi:SHS2 domain-containing protein